MASNMINLRTSDKPHSPLHNVKSKQEAQFLVESVNPGFRKYFLQSIDEEESSALHVAVIEGNLEVVEYLCEAAGKYDSDLITQVDRYGRTPLFYVNEEYVARLLVDSLSPEKQQSLLLSRTLCKETVLHEASAKGNASLVAYYCSIVLKLEEFVFSRDRFSRTPLHLASNGSTAKKLIRSVQHILKEKDIFLALDCNLSTPLHRAAEYGRAEVVECLCRISLSEDQLTQIDKFGRTPLHYAKTKDIAHIIINSMKKSYQRSYIMICDNEGQTALHSATMWGGGKKVALHTQSEGSRADVLKYLCKLIGPDLVTVKDNYGRTALHYADSFQDAQLLIDYSGSSPLEYISTRDDSGSNALAYLVLQFSPEDLSDMLDYIELEFGSDTLRKLAFTSLNTDKQSLLHLAPIFFTKTNDLCSIVLERLPPDFYNLMTADSEGYTPLDYMVFRTLLNPFAQTIISLPLAQRQMCFTHRNLLAYDRRKSKKSTEESKEEVFDVDVIWEMKNHSTIFQLNQIHEDIFRIVKYALNEYSLLDSAYILSLKLSSEYTLNLMSRLLQIAGNPSPVNVIKQVYVYNDIT